MQFNFLLLGSQLWKLDDNRLTNKERLWKFQSFGNPNEYWNFITNDDLIYIEAAHQFGLVLATTNDGEVILENLVPDKPEQLWNKGEPDTSGYFSLTNSKVRGAMTAVEESILEIKGNMHCVAKVYAFLPVSTVKYLYSGGWKQSRELRQFTI